jgi:hypothetical protein
MDYRFAVRHRRNRLRLAFAEAQIALRDWQARGVAPVAAPLVTCFVVGCGNSGTTLVASRLGLHPDAFVIPTETNIFEPRRSLARARARLVAAMDAARASGATVLVEKTPKHVHSLDRIRRLLPAARAIAVVRNPFDACLSIRKRFAAKRWGGLDYAIERWLIDNRAVLALRDDPLTTEVRYETLTTSPEAEFGRLLGFLGLSWDPGVLAAGASAYGTVTQRTSTMRLRADQVSQPIRPNTGQWRSALSQEEIARIRDRTGALWQALGGEPGSDGYRV